MITLRTYLGSIFSPHLKKVDAPKIFFPFYNKINNLSHSPTFNLSSRQFTRKPSFSEQNVFNESKNNNPNLVHFPATAKLQTSLPGLFTTEQIKKEPGLFGCDMDYSLNNGGEITVSFLKEFLKIPYVKKVYEGEVPGYQIIIDVKMHKLQKGELPSTPGWHTDFAEDGKNGEPDYNKFDKNVTTYIVNFSDNPKGVSNTVYTTQGIALNIPETNTYASMDKQLRSQPIATSVLKDGEIYEMDQYALHRGSPAHNDGIRGFIRVSILHKFPFMMNSKASNNNSNTPNLAHNRTRSKIQSYVLCKPEYLFESGLHIKSAQHFISPQKLTYYFPEKDLTKTHIWKLLNKVHTDTEIMQESNIINGSLDFASKNCGPLTKYFMHLMIGCPAVTQQWNLKKLHRVKISSYVHMLMKGQYPDIPEWRSSLPFDKNLNHQSINQYFILTLGNKKNSISEIEYECLNTFNSVNHTYKKLQNGQILHATEGMPHRSLPASESGWRLMLILAINDRPAENIITKQSRVYLDNSSVMCTCTVGANNERKD